ncbi:hypothetical protein P1J78_09685 [Psychromarinibacter sp. C21-152]|uniref:Uncharacterized protein n=1 Tax=Psychromarinibacter sediminicola TaxID=3033385 RepID=A0AAE3T9G4_9RHOB|nr:hypothetical protein [Psychromarinibacter sediminicola]MDF0600999.1 hypothetical protein [Psychromarinibacter sediminicola]
MTPEEIDRAGLIRESYRIEGISAEECRSIFMDWALQLPDGIDVRDAIGRLLAFYGQEGHPMTVVLREGLAAPRRPRRRGGWSGRRS